MSWQCRLINEDERDSVRVKNGGKLPPGTMWFMPMMLSEEHHGFYLEHTLSNEYKRDWLATRPPLIVVLPSRDWFCVDDRASDNADGHGWTVTGDPPDLTVSPSINAVGRYHGWLQGGVLSDDVEGRTYPEWAEVSA